MWLNHLNVHRRMGFGRAGLCFWDEFAGRLPLLGKIAIPARKFLKQTQSRVMLTEPRYKGI